jgi:hypothetical protein
MGIVDNALMGASGQGGGYNIDRSVRLRSSASASLTRTPASGSSQNRWTWSGWVKRGRLGVTQTLFSAYSASNYQTYINFTSSDTLQFNNFWGSDNENIITTQVFRDPSAWYHLVFAINLSASTYQNAVQMFVNGVQITAFSTTTFTNSFNAGAVNGTYPHSIGSYATQSSNYGDLYLAEVNFVDGSQLLPSSFGSFNAATGVWQPRKYSGSYGGTNGFYLPFTDNSALTTSSNVGLGKDFSGNGNYWTTNNISITSGVTYDSMTDVPTLTSATAANFAVMNPLMPSSALSWGNLRNTASAASATIQINSGKWYFESVATTSTVVDSNNYYVGITGGNFLVYAINGNRWNGSAWVAFGASYATGDVIGIAFDATAGTATFYKNNVSQGTQTGTGGLTVYPYSNITSSNTNSIFDYNFGQRPFTYTPPTGFVALNTFNLPTSTIVKGNTVMDATLYTGNGSTQTITNAAGFKPDFVWGKMRASNGGLGEYHQLYDSIRGVEKALFSNTTDAETNMSGGGVTAFNTNGFNVSATSNGININAKTYVGWQWQAGQGTTSSNTNGTITSTVSVNASAGFSVVTWTANASANQSIGHGLGVAPSLVIVKDRTTVINWNVWFTGFTANEYLLLNSTAAKASFSTLWYQVPDSSKFYVGSTATAANYQSGDAYVAYCWAPIAGYSAFGSYTGNGSTDGTFIYLGFRPKFFMIKVTNAVNAWLIVDSSRSTYNVMGSYLIPNASDAEGSATVMDFVSNGVKMRNTFNGWNASGENFIYMAFAENPFKNALAR